MIQKFHIHIGTYKTGTTSIQKLLLQHEDQLKLNDTYVIDRERDLPEVSKWLFPEWYDIEDLADQESKAIHQILAVKASSISYENIVYSEENFTDVLSAEEQNKRMVKLNFLIDMFSAQLTLVHVFFRDPQTLLFSWYKQLIRNRNYNYPSYQSFVEQNIDNILIACNWDEYSIRLEKGLKNHLLATHIYEDAKQNGLIKYFFEKILNIDSINIVDKKFNESQSDLKTRLMESISDIALNHKLSLKNTGWLKKAVFEMKDIDETTPLHNLSLENQQVLKKLSDIRISQLKKSGIKI